MEVETKELESLKGQMSKLESQANIVTIESQEEYSFAVDLVAQIKERGSQIKNLKESITKPINESLRHIRNLVAPVEAQHESAEAIIKSKLLAYKRKVDEEARVKEEKIAEKLGEGKITLTVAEKRIENIERVENTTRGNVGGIQIRKIKKVRVVSKNLLPMEYLLPDLPAIRRDALGGKEIPGVEIYEEETIAAGMY